MKSAIEREGWYSLQANSRSIPDELSTFIRSGFILDNYLLRTLHDSEMGAANVMRMTIPAHATKGINHASNNFCSTEG